MFKKHEEYDFVESFLLNIINKCNLRQKGKVIDRSNIFGLGINLWIHLDDELDLQDNLNILDFMKKYRFEQNEHSAPEFTEGVFYADGDRFVFSSGNKGGAKNKPFIRVYNT